MRKPKSNNMFTEFFTRIFQPTQGILLVHDISFPKEVCEFEDEVLSDLEMKKPHEDKINMRNDGLRLKKDARSAVADYHQEFSHG